MSTLVETERGAEDVPSAAQWLDLNYPGWANHVDADTLDMVDIFMCIGGQMGVNWLTLSKQWESDSGITDSDVFADFTDDWRREITARQG